MPSAKRVDEPATRYVPRQLDVGSWRAVEALFDELEGRRITTAAGLARWIEDAEELRAALYEEGAVRRVRLATDTADEAARRACEAFEGDIAVAARRRSHALDRKFLGHLPDHELPGERYGVYERAVRARSAIYREEDAARETEIQRKVREYERIVGERTIEWEGEERTVPQMARFIADSDRRVRERAWCRVVERQMADRDALAELYAELLALRVQMARNAGFHDFQSYRFLELGRFDYTPDDCRRFHASVERVFLPALAELAEHRRRRLGVERLRPWDVDVDVDGRPPLRPFASVEEMLDACEAIFGRIDPELRAQFHFLREEGLVDVESRRGKAPGGFGEDYPLRRLPFIFNNLTGLGSDLRSLVHEAGHAFHTLACRSEPIFAYRLMPIEFSEVAAMGMELLCLENLHGTLDAGAERRLRRDLFQRIVTLFPATAVADAFQERVYGHRAPATAAIDRTWAELHARFLPTVDWSGLEEVRAARWQQTPHFYNAPFFYVEYAFAEIGALQIWTSALRDPAPAVRRYREALALGGSKPLPELYRAAGAKFAFDEETLGPLARRAIAEATADPAATRWPATPA